MLVRVYGVRLLIVRHVGGVAVRSLVKCFLTTGGAWIRLACEWSGLCVGVVRGVFPRRHRATET
jgi:hypothetical protein